MPPKKQKKSEPVQASSSLSVPSHEKNKKNTQTKKRMKMKSSSKNKGNKKEEEDDDDDEEDDEEDEDEEDEDEDEDEEDVDGEDDDDDFINVEIEFVTPREEHFTNLKSYLTSYCDGTQFEVSQLVDLVLKQDNVGSVIASRVKEDEDEDPLGILTVMSLNKAKEFKCLEEMKQHIIKKAPKEEAKTVKDALNAKNTGLIISERLVNVPQDVGLPLVKQLFDEIKWAVKDEKKNEFAFDQYILVSRCYVDTFTPAVAASSAAAMNNKNNNKRKKKEEEVTELVFPNLEDEIFYEHSQWSFIWEAGGDDKPQEFSESKAMRMCMLIDANDIGKVRKGVDELFRSAF